MPFFSYFFTADFKNVPKCWSVPSGSPRVTRRPVVVVDGVEKELQNIKKEVTVISDKIRNNDKVAYSVLYCIVLYCVVLLSLIHI